MMMFVFLDSLVVSVGNKDAASLKTGYKTLSKNTYAAGNTDEDSNNSRDDQSVVEGIAVFSGKVVVVAPGAGVNSGDDRNANNIDNNNNNSSGDKGDQVL
jgi:hypothetical protein